MVIRSEERQVWRGRVKSNKFRIQLELKEIAMQDNSFA